MTDMLGSALYVVSDSPLSGLDFWRPYNILERKYEYNMRRWDNEQVRDCKLDQGVWPNHMAGTFLHMPES